MLERVRHWVGLSGTTEEAGRRRYVSRRAREDQQRRLLYIVTGVLALVVVVTLIVGAVWQYILVPRESYATVNGVEIRRSDYVKYRKYTLLQELSLLSNQLSSASQEQQPQIQQQISLLQLELQDLDEGERNIDPESLKEMVDDQLALQGLDDFGIVLTEEDVDNFVNELLAPVPLSEPTPTATVPPTAAAWATQTFEERLVQATTTAEFNATVAEQTAEAQGTAAEGSPTGTAEDAEGTEEATPAVTEAEGTEAATEGAATGTAGEATGTAGETGTPDPNATEGPTATPPPTIEPTATPNREQALATADANFNLLDENFLDRAGMSRGDFERIIARPQLARTRIQQMLEADIQTTQEQVHASHILVATRDAALELINGRLQEEDFAVVAEEVSTDTTSAVNGGDLGWFPRGVMTPPFEEAAFSQPVGELPEEPVQSQFGWHIILVTGHEDERPLTTTMIQAVRNSLFDRWLSEQREQANISAEVTLPVDDAPANLGGFPGGG